MKKTRILLADDHVITRMGLNMLFSSEPDMEVVGEADNGESAVLLKDTPTRRLVATLRKVLAGSTVIPGSVLEQAAADDAVPNLTERQQEIVHSLTRGLSNADIAKQLGITEFGVQKHLKLIFAKLGAATRAEAAAIALRKHLLKI